MGLALAIVIGFFGVIGLSHPKIAMQKPLQKTQAPLVKAKQKQLVRKVIKAKKAVVRLDGIQIRNLKG